jgi:hypothetical protein
MDVKRFSRADWIVLAGALITFVGMFLPWYRLKTPFGILSLPSLEDTGWQSSIGIAIWILSLVAASLVLPKAIARLELRLPIPGPLAIMACGGLATLLMLVKLVDKPTGGGTYWSLSGYVVIPLVGVALVALGGFLKNSEPTS